MGSEVVQFRLPSETVAEIRKLGLNPNEFGRTAIEAELRRVKARAKIESLQDIRARLARLGGRSFDPVAAIRAERDR